MWPPQPHTSNPQNDYIYSEHVHLRHIAQGTIDAINSGYVECAAVASDSDMPLTRHSIRKYTDYASNHTKYFKPESTRLKYWTQGPPPAAVARRRHRRDDDQLLIPAQVLIMKMSTLQGARHLSEMRPLSKIGVLNFASGTKPGGWFIEGSNTQEASLTRSSTLFLSLQTPQSKPFYELHNKDGTGGYHSHAMIYSPSIAIFRDDDGQWLQPYHANIVTSPPVNASIVRKKTSDGQSKAEDKILAVMRERMGRILALFELSGTRNLVLGSFGTGLSQNNITSLAKIWGELLIAPGARFADSFDKVIFAIPDIDTEWKFRKGFNSAATGHGVQDVDRTVYNTLSGLDHPRPNLTAAVS